MARSLPEIVFDLIKNVTELKDIVGVTQSVEAFTVTKRGPGRPRKAGETVAKRGPGRPRRAAAAVEAAPAAPPAPKPAKKAKKSAKKDPARQAQGRYMAAMKGLSEENSAVVKKVYAEKGIKEATKVANSIQKEMKKAAKEAKNAQEKKAANKG